jgi:hypothetical protein
MDEMALLKKEFRWAPIALRRTGRMELPSKINAEVGHQMLSPDQEDFEKYGFPRPNYYTKSIT